MPDRPGIRLRWRAGLGLALLAGPAWAGVVIHRDREDLRSRESCVLRVEAPGEGPRRWRWCLRGPDPDGRVLRAEGEAVRFTAPPTGQGGHLTVAVEAEDDPFLGAEAILEIRPGEDGEPVDAFRPGVHAAALCGFLGAVPPDSGGLPARRRALARFRQAQSEVRAVKHRDRARRQALALGSPAESGAPAAPDPRPQAGTGPRNPLRGVFWITVAGLAALNAPEWQAALGQAVWTGAPTPLMGRFDRVVQDSLASLAPPCAAAFLAGRSVPACSPAYHRSLLARSASVKAQMAQLLVDPETLDAGSCRRPEESRRQARARIALVQGGWLALFDRLAGAATALQFQLDRDALVLTTVGAGLVAARFETMAVAGNSTAIRTAAFALGETGTGLNLASFALQSRAATVGTVATAAQSNRAGYQLSGNRRAEALLDCVEEQPPVEPYPVSTVGETFLDSPLTALEEAFLQISEGCAIVRRHALALPVCDELAAEDFAGHNHTLAELWNLRIPCLTSGQLEGQQGPCPRAPLADALSRSNTFAWFLKFQAEASGAGYAAFALGNGFFAGAQGIVLEANALLLVGDTAQANQALAEANLLNAVGAGIYANGYDLLRLAGDSRVVAAEVTLRFNQESWAELEQKLPASGNPTGPARQGGPPEESVDPDDSEPEEDLPSSTAVAGESAADAGGTGTAGLQTAVSTLVPSALEVAEGTGTANAADRTRVTPLGWLLLRWQP